MRNWLKKCTVYTLSFILILGNMTFLTPFEFAEASVNTEHGTDTVPPAAPSGLSAMPGDQQITLNWGANQEEDMAEYRIYVDGVKHGTVTSSVYTYNVSPLEAGREYDLTLSAVDGSDNESEKVTVKAIPAGALPVTVPNLLITELVPDTSNFASYDAFEFIELYNAGDGAIDLKDYRILSDKWNKVIDTSIVIGGRESVVFWTRRAEIEPLTWEAFNSYYFTSYTSKYVPNERSFIIGNVGGLVNSGAQSVVLQDSAGNEVVRAPYIGGDVAEGKSITFTYPEEGSKQMRQLASKQQPTPGWVIEGQAPPREKDDQAPVKLTGLNAEAGNGTVKLTWDPNTEPDIERYNIYKDGTLEFSVPADQQMFEVYGLTGNVAYNFEVTGVDRSDLESPKSDVVTATPFHQKVTQVERTPNPLDSKYKMLWDISEEGPVIPGLKQDLVPQGIAYYKEKNWILAVYYMDDGRPGTLSVLDEASGKLLKSVILMNEDGTPYTGHAGGIAVSPGYVWIASGEFLFQIKLEDLVKAEDNGEIQFIDSVPVPVQASFNYFADGVLWVGEFYEQKSYPTDASHTMTNRTGETYYAWMAGYELDQTTGSISSEDWIPGSTTPATPDKVLSIPGKVQGAVVREDGVILSTSWGRGNDSLFYWYNNQLKESAHATAAINGRDVPVWFLDTQAEKEHNSRLSIVPMSEGIVDVDGELYVQLESGATKYRYTTTYIMDRMVKINLNRWAKYGLEEPSVDPGIPQVLIFQFMYDVPGTDDGAEYIVIKNYEEKPVDISGFMIGDGINQTKGEGMAAFPPGTIINPGQEIILAQSGIRFKQIYGTVPDFETPWIGVTRPVDDPDIPDLLPTDWSTGIIQLANGGDEILLMNAKTDIVDFVPYIIDRTYRDVFYKAVTATAPGDGNAIHRIGRTGSLPADFAAAPPSLGDRPIPLPTSDNLLITEVMYDPLFDEVLGEFVEITNISDQAVDISGYYLGDEETEGQASPEGMFNFPAGTVIKPYEVLLIARNAKGVEDLYGRKADFELEDSDSSVAKMEPNCSWGCGTMQLANTGDEVLLLDRNKKLVDAFVYKSGMYMGIKAHRGVNSGHSLERISGKDTKNSAADFVDQPRPTPGVLLFGPQGREDLIPVSDLKDNVLQVKEPQSAVAAVPTVIDASNGMPDELPGNIPSFLIQVRWSGSELYAANRKMSLSAALDRIDGRMLPVIEINESSMVQPLHQVLSARGMTDALIVSTRPDIIKQIRGLNDEYRGAVRFEDSKLSEQDVKEIIRTVRQSTGLVALIDQQALTKEHVRSLFVRSVSVWGYGVKSESEAHRLISMGVSGIEASDSTAVAAALGKYGVTDSITQQPIIVAHRGMSALAPENTMPAFELAVEKGAEVIELDILESKDGELVLIHDYTVDRTTNGKGRVSELTLEQLKSLTANKTNNPDWQKEYDKYPDAKIPTLEEVLAFAKGKNVVLALEMKGFGHEDKVIDLVEKYHMESDVYVTSFSQDVLQRVELENPEIGRGYTLDGGKPSPAEALQDAEKVVTDHVQLGTFYFANYSILTPELISYAKHRGLPVIAWTINNKQGLQDAVSMGITGLITDYAHWMDQVAVNISSGKDSYELKVGETLSLEDMNALVHFKAMEPVPFTGRMRIVTGNEGAVSLENSGGIKGLKPGTVSVQLYLDYKPFSIPVDGDPVVLDNTWRMYSEPVTVIVKKGDGGNPEGPGNPPEEPGSSAPSTGGINVPPQGTGSTKKELLEPTEQERKAAKGSFTLTGDQHTLIIPTEFKSWLNTNQLQVQRDGFVLTIPEAVLEGAAEMIDPSSGAAAKVMISIRLLDAEQSKQGAEQLGRLTSAHVKAASRMAEFQINVVTKDGVTISVGKLKQPVTIKLPLNDNTDPWLAGLYHTAEDGRSKYVNSRITDGILAGEISLLGKYTALEYRKTFSDVPESFWAAKVIQQLTAKHLVEGTAVDRFSPQDKVTRAQFVTLLARALNLQGGQKTPFSDVPTGQWFTGPVAAAHEAGLIEGVSAGRFAPNQTITREEMAVLMVRAYQYVSKENGTNAQQIRFADEGDISAWAQESVRKAAQLGLMQGRTDGNMAPKAMTTRAESVQALYNLITSLKRLP